MCGNDFLQAAHAQEMEKQLLQSKISIMLSQIQPHFLYNSLTAIRQLCDIDPQKAKQAVTLFARYLRGNTESLTTAHCIPFEKELEHVKSYLALEQIRFEDELQVEYDIQAHGFLLPSLSLQPLVENAVRHGVSKKAGGGKVTIRTTETGTRLWLRSATTAWVLIRIVCPRAGICPWESKMSAADCGACAAGRWLYAAYRAQACQPSSRYPKKGPHHEYHCRGRRKTGAEGPDADFGACLA